MEDSLESQRSEFKIKRKPTASESLQTDDALRDADEASILSEKTQILILQPRSTTLLTNGSKNELGLVQSPTSFSTVSTTSSSSSLQSPKWKHAWGEARHFLGGLWHHPHETTKHYTILRHSHGLVYYVGPKTSITVSIFSDAALPPDRRFFLQNKGWSGKSGMKIKAALRTNKSWIEVTPSTAVTASQLPPAEERAWQRDIAHFAKKASKEKLQHHILRETDVVRIPAEAQDGYFRILLTGVDSRKVLCPSPVFRLASTSMSASSIRGASLTTLPIELGIKVGSIVANTMAHNAISPVTDTISSQMQQYVPSSAQSAVTTAYDMTSVQGKIDGLNERFDQKREDFVSSPLGEGDNDISVLDRPDILGDDSGPTDPFPIRLDSKIIQGTGRSTLDLGMPTANLRSSPLDFQARLSGVYFGWASFPETDLEELSAGEWQEAIISVGLCPYANPKVAPKEIIKVHILHDFGAHTLLGTNISVLVMSFLRPTILPASDSLVLETARDLSITRASLARETWQPSAGLEQIEKRKSGRGVAEKCVDARMAGQRQFERVPLHKLGIRTPGAAWKDRLVSRGGMYVKRD